jgi:YD repeat-containing protein
VPPVKPAALTAIQVGATVRLSWGLVPDAASYKLKRISGTVVTALPDATTTSAIDASVAVDTNYSYQIQACNKSGCSDWTVAADIKVPHIPAPPTAVKAIVRQNVIFVTWPNNDNATSAKLTRNSAQISAAARAPYTDSGVIAGTVYTYGVSACNATGCSAVVSSAAVTAGLVQAGPTVMRGYDYNALGRLTKVKEDGSLKTQYDYDKAGNRKQVNE